MTNNPLLQKLHDLNASDEILSAVKDFLADYPRQYERERKAAYRKRKPFIQDVVRDKLKMSGTCPGQLSGTVENIKETDDGMSGTLSGTPPPGSPSLSPLTLSPITTLPSPSKAIARQASNWKHDAAFMAFYGAYPRHVAPAAAYKAFLRVLNHKLATPEALRDAAERYAREKAGEEPQFVKHPSTWLNGGCWADGEHVEDQERKRRKDLFNGHDNQKELLAARDEIWREIEREGVAGDRNGHPGVQSLAPVLRKPSGFRPLGAGAVYRGKAE